MNISRSQVLNADPDIISDKTLLLCLHLIMIRIMTDRLTEIVYIHRFIGTLGTRIKTD